jgi:hypothetical protein
MRLLCDVWAPLFVFTAHLLSFSISLGGLVLLFLPFPGALFFAAEATMARRPFGNG